MLSLQWIASHKIVDGYVLGVDNKKQFLENINLINNYKLKMSVYKKLLELTQNFKIPEEVVNPSKW